MAFVIKDGMMVRIPGGMVFKTIGDMWQWVDGQLASPLNNNRHNTIDGEQDNESDDG